MKATIPDKIYNKISRLSFIKRLTLALGIAFVNKSCNKEEVPEDKERLKVYMVQNGTVKENINKLLELLGGISKYIDPTDVVILKCNGQWPNQGYTNTECIKYLIDLILAIPGFSGEILICDNIQFTPNQETGFLASVNNRKNNWADHNWNTLADYYQSKNAPVASVSWNVDPIEKEISGPFDGPGWIRNFFQFHGYTTYLSYPIFQSPVTPGRLIDMKNGIWESGGYTDRRVRTIFMPTLNNHGKNFEEDYAGITSAIKCFFGATENHDNENAIINFNGQLCHHMHSASYTSGKADYAGELTALYIKELYSPILYITCAIWSGVESRKGAAIETKTVLACDNPATLDYISCKYVISPLAGWLDPDKNNNTRRQILGCIKGGIGTIDPNDYEIVTYDFNKK